MGHMLARVGNVKDRGERWEKVRELTFTCKPRMDDGDADVFLCDDGVQSAHQT
jgi:hypothetical protein